MSQSHTPNKTTVAVKTAPKFPQLPPFFRGVASGRASNSGTPFPRSRQLPPPRSGDAAHQQKSQTVCGRTARRPARSRSKSSCQVVAVTADSSMSPTGPSMPLLQPADGIVVQFIASTPKKTLPDNQRANGVQFSASTSGGSYANCGGFETPPAAPRPKQQRRPAKHPARCGGHGKVHRAEIRHCGIAVALIKGQSHDLPATSLPTCPQAILPAGMEATRPPPGQQIELKLVAADWLHRVCGSNAAQHEGNRQDRQHGGEQGQCARHGRFWPDDVRRFERSRGNNPSVPSRAARG